MQSIKIDKISQDTVQFGIKTTIESGKNKYSFFNTKRDGGKTKAQEQFDKYGYRVGDVVNCEVKEENKTFTNDKGKNVSYIQRTILFFEEVENTPTFGKSTQSEPKPTQNDTRAILADHEARLKALEKNSPALPIDDIDPESLPY